MAFCSVRFAVCTTNWYIIPRTLVITGCTRTSAIAFDIPVSSLETHHETMDNQFIVKFTDQTIFHSSIFSVILSKTNQHTVIRDGSTFEHLFGENVLVGPPFQMSI